MLTKEERPETEQSVHLLWLPYSQLLALWGRKLDQWEQDKQECKAGPLTLKALGMILVVDVPHKAIVFKKFMWRMLEILEGLWQASVAGGEGIWRAVRREREALVKQAVRSLRHWRGVGAERLTCIPWSSGRGSAPVPADAPWNPAPIPRGSRWEDCCCVWSSSCVECGDPV